MTKAISNKKFLSAALLFMSVFIFFPLMSSAEELITVKCQPEDQTAVDQTCIFDKQASGHYVNLKWDIPGNFTKPLCQVQCFNPIPLEGGCPVGSYGYRHKNASGTDVLFVPADAAAQAQATKLAPQDNGNVEYPNPGVYYQASCHSTEGSDTTDHWSQKMSIVMGVPCETTFDSIINRIYFTDSGAAQNLPAIITEKNFNGWAAYETRDRASEGQGSGDQQDLIDKIVSQQGKCFGNTSILGKDYTEIAQNVSAFVQNNLTPDGDAKRDVVPFSFDEYSATGAYKGMGHAIVLLSVKKDGKAITFEFVDPNGPSIGTLVCGTSILRSNKGVPLCVPSPKRNYGPYVIPNFYQYGVDLINSYKSQLSAIQASPYCQNNAGNPSYADYCQRKPADWLRNNYPNISNPRIGLFGASCRGWSDFVFRTTYLGDFVGTDYHPSDITYVSSSCDQNHHSLQSKPTASLAAPSIAVKGSAPRSWLARLAPANIFRKIMSLFRI